MKTKEFRAHYIAYLEARIKIEYEEYEKMKKEDLIKAHREVYPRICMLENILNTFKEFYSCYIEEA